MWYVSDRLDAEDLDRDRSRKVDKRRFGWPSDAGLLDQVFIDPENFCALYEIGVWWTWPV